jgi:putative membrane protein
MLPGGNMVDIEPDDTNPIDSRPALIRRDILAAKRTELSASNSLKGWIRTGLSLIGFGFTIYSFLISLPNQFSKASPVEVGLFLIGMGTVSILFGAAEYWENMRELHEDYGIPIKKIPMLFGLLVAGFGAVLFFQIITHQV